MRSRGPFPGSTGGRMGGRWRSGNALCSHTARRACESVLDPLNLARGVFVVCRREAGLWRGRARDGLRQRRPRAPEDDEVGAARQHALPTSRSYPFRSPPNLTAGAARLQRNVVTANIPWRGNAASLSQFDGGSEASCPIANGCSYWAAAAATTANCGADVDGVPASVTPCTAIEGADSVVCTDEWHSVPTSCHDGLELVDGICIETRSNGIDCSAVDASLPCNVMLLLAQMREAAAHSDTFVIDPVMFCPCKVVLDASPDWTPSVVQSCSGSGGGGR